MEYLLKNYFVTIFLIVGFSINIYRHRKTNDTQLHFFWLTIISTIILVISDTLESYAAEYEYMRTWRILFSVIGYVFRPLSALSIAVVVSPKHHHSLFLWIPCFINTAIFLTAFFSPVAFSFDESYLFIRGPLGYSVFVVSAYYIICSLILMQIQYKKDDHSMRRIVLYICAVSCFATSIIDAVYGGARLNMTIMISSIFLYMFLRSFDTHKDPLTSVFNRIEFYYDCERYRTSISAIASIDMNGLKKLNDKKGHEAGDNALKRIGFALQSVSNKNIFPYRIGGDEFVILFIKQEEITVKNTISTIKAITNAGDIYISTGYAMQTKDTHLDGKLDINKLLQLSDSRMYENKKQYYAQN